MHVQWGNFSACHCLLKLSSERFAYSKTMLNDISKFHWHWALLISLKLLFQQHILRYILWKLIFLLFQWWWYDFKCECWCCSMHCAIIWHCHIQHNTSYARAHTIIPLIDWCFRLQSFRYKIFIVLKFTIFSVNIRRTYSKSYGDDCYKCHAYI